MVAPRENTASLMEPAREPRPSGFPRIGDYRLEEKLGEGGMGAVYRARSLALPDVAVAIKVMTQAPDTSPLAAARFAREMQTLAAIPPHPNLVRIHGGSLAGERPYYVMELVEGTSLMGAVEKGPLEPRRAATLVRDLALAVAHIHAHDVLHRDLKPENVLIDAAGRPRLCDFGIARTLGSERLTRTGAFLGTPAFAAPEQLAGSSAGIGPAADIYGLGGLLWFALVGRVPFDATSLETLVLRVITEIAARPSSLVPGVPAALDTICLRALAKAPADRHASAADLALDLDAFLEGRVPPSLEAAQQAGRRRRLRTLVVLAAATAVATAGLVGVRLSGRATIRARVQAALESKDAPAIEAALADLTRSGLDRADQEALERRLGELTELDVAGASPSLDRSGGASLAALRAAAARLEHLGARAAPARGRVLLRLAARLAHDIPAAPARERPALRRDLARVAALGPPGLSLVGEPGEPAGGIADGLLDADDSPALDGARALATARIAASPGDAAAHALRAYVQATRAGEPTQPLGTGSLDLGPPGELEDDLAAASALEGAAGARAAWLLVERLLARGPAASGELDRTRLDPALVRARRFPGETAARTALEETVATAPPAVNEATALFTRLEAASRAGDGRAPFALARLLAAWGAPAAIEHPELATDESGAALSAALRRDPPPAFTWRPPAALDPGVGDPVTGVAPEQREHGLALSHQPVDPEAVARTKAAFRRALAAALAVAPNDPEVLAVAGDTTFRRLSTGVFRVLALRTRLDMFEVLSCFGEASRIERAVYPLNTLGPAWDIPQDGFDAALEADVATDELVAVAREHGLAPSEIADAIHSVEAMRRVAEISDLTEAGREVPPRLAFQALVQTETLVRCVGLAGLPIRACLRSLVLHGGLGDGLYALDADRLAARLRTVASPGPHAEELALFMADVAAAAPGPRASARWIRLYELGVRWGHARFTALARTARPDAPGQQLQDTLTNVSTVLTVTHQFLALRKRRGVERIRADWTSTAEELDRAIRPNAFDPLQDR